MNGARQTTPASVLLVGAGRRIRNNFLPALAQISDHLAVDALWARNAEQAAAAAQPWGVTVAPNLEVASATADVVMVSVTTSAVPEILQRLVPFAERLTLVLDTPVFGSVRDLRALPGLSRFRRVVVAEDYAQFPQWQLARQVVASGVIGEVVDVELRHSGYRYHGLALARSFYGYPFARAAFRRGGELRFHFGSGRGGRIVLPYDQARGTTVIRGSGGALVHGEVADRDTGAGPVIALRIDEHADPPAVVAGEQRLELPRLPALLGAPVPDRTMFNALKTYGLMAALAPVWTAEPPAYDYRQALYDHLTTATLQISPILMDPFAPFRWNYVHAVDRVLAATPARTA